jgi:type II secretory ATPase GspE/PulE/Tfp pilus assembly ATPase PilB-like protein
VEVAGNAPELVGAVLRRAATQAASDIHIEPGREGTGLRFRVDGILHHVADLPADRSLEFISRLKVLCNMDIAEKRRPQDGRFRFSMGGRDIDVRVSTVPTESGEKMVLRLLDQDQLAPELEELGLDPRDQGFVIETIGRTQGMLLVTGPTGSGKTTTLYSCLRRIRDPRLNIMTIEDPIEYRLDGVNQSQAKPDIGYTFAGALRSFLRQDPNVIMVGEIRDSETAQIALRAAMTGHLVLSTVHTNDAATTITRLLDLGAEPYLIASSVSLIVAQRLVRRLCPDCSQPADSGPPGTLKAVGCSACAHTGYRGRVGVFEVLKVDPAIQDLIHARAPAEHIREQAKANGMRLLVEDARQKWLRAVTTFDEIEREIGSAEAIQPESLSKSAGSAQGPSTSRSL